MDEYWAQVEGYEHYIVSNYGHVANNDTSRLLVPRSNSKGYFKVTLCRLGIKKECYIHRLVAEAFLPEFTRHDDVFHIDRDGANNRLDNLAVKTKREPHILDKDPEYADIRRVLCVETGVSFRSAKEAAQQMGLDYTSIYKVLRGARYSHRGYTFDWVYPEVD